MIKERLGRVDVVTSAYKGVVAEVKMNPGEVIDRGGVILSIIPDPVANPGDDPVASLVATIYVDAADGKKVKPGMPVEVIPTIVRREEDGFVKGKVTYVSVAPATVEGDHPRAEEQTIRAKTLERRGAVRGAGRVTGRSEHAEPSRLVDLARTQRRHHQRHADPRRDHLALRAVAAAHRSSDEALSRPVAADARPHPSEHRAVSGAAISWLPRRRVRVPTILQLEAAECGAACLAMVLAAHGRRAPLAELREACGVGREGVKASNILVAAREAGLLAKGLRVELDDLATIACPFVAFWNFNHFVVIEQYRAQGRRLRAWINDPNGGPRAVGGEEFAEAFTGVALTFERRPDFTPRARRRSGSPTW